MQKSFSQIYREHVGKVTDKWTFYLYEYDRLFATYREEAIQILEIGIQNGGSLEIWGKYFQKAKQIIGCDIDPKCGLLKFLDTRISVVVGNANSDECENGIRDLAPQFNIIIDDGSHKSSDIVHSFCRYFPLLEENGVYIVEDLHCSYWNNYEGGLNYPLSAMSFFKRLADIINYEHWRNNTSRENLLAKFYEESGINLSEYDLSTIHSIEFTNSLCVIKKSPEKYNLIGKRIIAGTDELVTSGWKKLNDTSIAVFEKNDDNSLDYYECISEVLKLTTQVRGYVQEIKLMNNHINELEQTKKELKSQLWEIKGSKAWKIALLFRQVRMILIPLNNRRFRVLKYLFRKVYNPFIKIFHFLFNNIITQNMGGNHLIKETSFLFDISSVSPLDSQPGSIGVHVHLFYSDLISEFATYLRNIPYKYDLFVSVPDQRTYKMVSDSFKSFSNNSSIDVQIVPNRGRDIAPFYCTFGNKLIKYDFVAHIHGKKSIYNNNSTLGWREYLCNNLMGSKERIKQIFTLFTNTAYIGLIYPQHFKNIPYTANTWLSNKNQGFQLCQKFGIKTVPEGYFDFPEGNMFWARAKALKPIFEAGLKYEDFPVETGQKDGTLAHSLERLPVLLCNSLGYTHYIIKDLESISWSTWRIDQYINKSIQNLFSQINDPKIKIVAFDIFDTLFIRPILNPKTIITIIAEQLSEINKLLYLEYRERADELAREKNGRDVNLGQIYAMFGQLTMLSTQELSLIYNIEMNIERKLVFPRTECIDIYHKIKSLGKKVILVSDMFLPKDLLESMLLEHNINKWDFFYLSNEIGLRKDTGKIYDFILEHELISPSEMVMIGDNEHSDWQIPSDKGIGTYHILRPVELARSLPRFRNLLEKVENKNDLNEQILMGLIINKTFSQIFYDTFIPDSLIIPNHYHLGYSIVGPIILSFIEWLRRVSVEDGVERLNFLSREGKILKRIYDLYVKNDPNAPVSNYLVLSRRATTVPAIRIFADILKICQVNYSENTIVDFLSQRFGLILSENRWEEIGLKMNWNKKMKIKINYGLMDPSLINFFKEIQNDIYTEANDELPPMRSYLHNEGLFDKQKNAIVDIGYSGTVQDSLNKLTNNKIHGYYMMTKDKISEVQNKHGVIAKGYYTNLNNPSVNFTILYKYLFQLEKLLSSDDPQVERYVKVKEEKIEGVFRALSDLEIGGNPLRAEINSGIIDFVQDYLNIKNNIYPNLVISPNLTIELFNEFMINISDKERILISSITLDDFYCGEGLV